MKLYTLIFALLCDINFAFLLVVVYGAEEVKSNWQLESVRNFYLRQLEPYSWQGDPEAWKEIFEALGLELSDTSASDNEH